MTGKRNIKSLHVYCDNNTSGCEWVGELLSLSKHLTVCDYVLVPCPNKCDDGEVVVKVLYKDLEKHSQEECPRRWHQCPYCLEFGEYWERTTTHLEECFKIEISCPNKGCSERIIRSEIINHRLKCVYEVVSCRYAVIGCKKKTPRQDLEVHESDSLEHLGLAIDTVVKLQSTIKCHEDELQRLDNLVRDQNLKIKEQNRKIDHTAKEQEQIQAALDVQTCELERLMSTIAKSHQGPRTVSYQLVHYEKNKSTGEANYCPPFYTSPTGYKMCISVYPSSVGDDNGTYISVYAHLMQGDNDDHLPWPFTGVVTVKLLNQLENSNHYSKAITFSSNSPVSQRVVDQKQPKHKNGYGYAQFISHARLKYDTNKHCQYLMDDCLYFRITVSTKTSTKTSTKPWLC